MILHCKNAEMTIILSFLHFYSVKSYNIVISAFLQCKIIQFLLIFFLIFNYYFFFNLAVFYIEKIKKVKNNFFFFF